MIYQVRDEHDFTIEVGMDGKEICEGTLEECRRAIGYYFEAEYPSEFWSITSDGEIVERWHYCREHSESYQMSEGCEFCLKGEPEPE